jgi:predicted amidohydrolase
MRVTSIQLEIKDRSKEETLDHVFYLLERIPQSNIILLPELWTCGFFSFDRYLADSEPLNGPTVKAFQLEASKLNSYILMGSFVERDNQKLFNTSLLLDPQGRIQARYRKIHLFGYQSEEKRLLTRGEEIVVTETPWGKVGLATCYDLRFPEFFRKMVDQGAIYFLVVSAWPMARLESWFLFNRVRAHENLAYLFSCNCTGINKGNRYAGHSLFVNPLGEIIADGGETEWILSMEVDIEFVSLIRKEFSALEDRFFK